jgi:HSP20 family molecular chaperone IbpA
MKTTIILGPRHHSPYDQPFGGSNVGHTTAYSSSTSQHQSRDRHSPSRPIYGSSTATNSFNRSSSPTQTFRSATNFPSTRTTFPAPSHGEHSNVHEQTFTESHRETRHRRSSPNTGVQSSHEVEHHRSGSPSISRGLDEDRFRSSLSLGGHSVTPPSSSRNLEVREFSRRVGSGTNNQTNDRFPHNDTSIFARDFNADAFYRSAFQPQVFTDDRGQKRIEMKLDVNNYQPNEIKVSVNGNDLIVQAEHSVERPPTSSTRAYFYKQITLPSNTDLSSLTSQYHPDGRLHITAKISNEQSAIRYN